MSLDERETSCTKLESGLVALVVILAGVAAYGFVAVALGTTKTVTAT